jgi:superfamily I DNA and/or RNA helicase
MDVIACTYVNCASELMKENFEFTVGIHEESSRAKLGTQTCALVYEGVKAHIFIGDSKQMPPMTTADHFNEHRHTAAASGLITLIEQACKVWWINEQYRMHPSMLSFPNSEWYNNILTNAPHTYVDTPIRAFFRQVILERYKIDLSKKEDGKGSQYLVVDVPKGLGLTPEGSTSLVNYTSASALVSVVGDLLQRPDILTSDKIAIGVWYKKQGDLIRDMLREKDPKVSRIATIDAYQSQDASCWLVDLTAHSEELVHRLHGPMEQSTWQSISSHVKSPHRLNVALTRGKDGVVVFGNFRSIANAVKHHYTSKDSSGKALSDFIADAGARDLMVVDHTADTNPATQLRFQQTQMNLAWIDAHIRANHKARKYDMPAYRSSKRTTYAGPDEGGAFGAFPDRECDNVKARSEVEGATKGSTQPTSLFGQSGSSKRKAKKPKG